MSPDTFATIANAVRVTPDASTLRGCFPDVHFTECSEDDVPARLTPAADCGNYSLFLIQGASGHCIGFTTELEAATGVVLARKSDDQ